MSTKALRPILRPIPLLCGALLCAAVSQAATDAKSASSLSAAQVAEKNVAARGGAEAWHAVRTLSVTGTIDAGVPDSIARSRRVAEGGQGASVKRAHAAAVVGDQNKSDGQVKLPFKLELKRPHMSRLEVEFAGSTAVQVYDGSSGWKLRPYLNRADAEPFSADEARYESEKSDLEGPLLDYATKGSKIELAGIENVQGHSAYKLKLTLKGGDVQHVWVDTQSFLDVKLEGIQHRVDGRVRPVWMYQRDFRSVQGLKVPFEVETVVDGSPQGHKMVVQTLAVNRSIEDARFAKPQLMAAQTPAASKAAGIGSR